MVLNRRMPPELQLNYGKTTQVSIRGAILSCATSIRDFGNAVFLVRAGTLSTFGASLARKYAPTPPRPTAEPNQVS